MAKRGRPRLYDQKPTPEVAARRARLAGGGDPAMTSSALDLLCLRGLISRRQCDAGRLFAWLRAQVYGRATPRALDPTRLPGADAMARDDAKFEQAYAAAAELLARQGPRVRGVTEAVSVHDRWPAALLPARARPETQAMSELTLLRAGLGALDQALTLARHNSAATTELAGNARPAASLA